MFLSRFVATWITFLTYGDHFSKVFELLDFCSSLRYLFTLYSSCYSYLWTFLFLAVQRVTSYFKFIDHHFKCWSHWNFFFLMNHSKTYNSHFRNWNFFVRFIPLTRRLWLIANNLIKVKSLPLLTKMISFLWKRIGCVCFYCLDDLKCNEPLVMSVLLLLPLWPVNWYESMWLYRNQNTTTKRK